METLNFQDSAFLRLESDRCPFHVAGLLILKRPRNEPPGFARRLAGHMAKLPLLWPMLGRQLADPSTGGKYAWTTADAYDHACHVLHYALSQPGRMRDLMQLVARVHERPLDRSRPLWELHLIEGLPGRRIAIYCKVHHALVDGIGALGMLKAIFSEDPQARFRVAAAESAAGEHRQRLSLARQRASTTDAVFRQYRALPELSSLLSAMGIDALLGRKDSPQLPFTAPRTIFNTRLDSKRAIITCDLPFRAMRDVAHRAGGTVNDVLLAVCGGAMRDYLLSLDALPAESLAAGVPVSLKKAGQVEGNRLSFLICPLATNERDPQKRLQRIVRATTTAKRRLAKVSPTASQDYTNLLLLPVMALIISGNATRVTPVLNALVSNVPGSQSPLYLDGARLEGIYPLSVIADTLAINFTAVSYTNKLCLAITACPTSLPGIERIQELLAENFRRLQAVFPAGPVGRRSAR